MSGHEEHHQHHEQQAPIQSVVDDNIIGSSVVLPVAHSNILDYIYLSGISLLPVYGGGGVGGGGGGVSWNQYNEMEQAMASILSGSLYERNPVKKVIDEEACHEIKEHAFTAALVEEMKINSACGIWQEEFEEGEAIKILPCNHAFKAEAIMKWLKEEKAECPMCRFVLKSKEHVCRENDNDDDDDDDDDNNENGEIHGNDEPEHEPELNNNAIRVNNIASRLVQSVAGRVNRIYSNPPYGYEESISVPINHLIERRRNMISQARNLVAMRASIPSSGGAAAASYANAHREVRAVPGNNEYNRINNINPPVLNIINNNNYNYNYYNRNMIDDNNYNNNNYNRNRNMIDDNNYNRNMNNNNNRNMNDDNNDNNNNNNNNNIHHIHIDEMHQEVVSNQEQADIEEAIRRSLE